MFANTKFFAIALALAASLPVGIAVPATTRDVPDGITCETTEGSPDTGSVTDVINQVRGQETYACGNDNDMGSGCTTQVSHKEAAISMCGSPGGMSCPEVASLANAIQQTCLSNGRVGGQYRKGEYIIEVIHS
ncbi:uncharacterized protein K452DRAFT_312739 [Aplosporella prunicola CBS 121167]|uniref:Ecp2 effector protein domain-containing protein n=1 Tax=Aplosporella prunicola CBS 121167 TaxID=1176127 RepID=A0A6A6B1N7_9PEZI|nr:uncharacterized protein K452DRAFT_312739 [Aplosporella prunicola CBS 121167]KAF2136927.1 hypothetical protein K452DRAFT_312739 [Aplosporella prunicola CBS 121167]